MGEFLGLGGSVGRQDGGRDVCHGSGARSTHPQNVESGTEDRCGGSQAHAGLVRRLGAAGGRWWHWHGASHHLGSG